MTDPEKKPIDMAYRKILAFGGFLSVTEGDLKTEVVKKRFDDSYRTILSVSGIFSFAFANYAMGFSNTFIYKIGIPFILTALVIFFTAHILSRSWEFKVKFIGLFLAWFATISLLSIVYLKDLVGSMFGYTGWLFFDFLLSMSIIPIVGSILVSSGIISKRYIVFMICFGAFICLGAYFHLSP